MGLDSVELVMEVENYFSISIPDREAEKAFTVGKLVDCVAAILDINKYDFELREHTFRAIKEVIILDTKTDFHFLITDTVGNTLDIKEKPLIIQLEKFLGLHFPGIQTHNPGNGDLVAKIKHRFSVAPHIDFKTITWKKYIDILLAFNLEKVMSPGRIKSKYEIYIVLMKIIVEKIGVDFLEIGLEKSFSNDLGVN